MLPLLIVIGGAAYSTIKALQQYQPPSAKDDRREATAPAEDIDRSAQMQELDEAEATHYLKVTAVAVGASVATLVYPPAGIATVSLLTYLGIPLFKSAAVATFIEAKPRSCHVESLVYAASMVSGYYVLTSLCSGIYFYSYKLMAKTRRQSSARLQRLFTDNPRHVWLVYDDIEVEVPFDTLQQGDIIVLQAGELVPIDGAIERGVATVDQRSLTGEAMPVEKSTGDAILASTSLLSGKIHVRVEKTGSATTAASIQRVLDRTHHYTDTVELEASRFSNRLAGPTLLAGGVAGIMLGPMQGIALAGSNQSELNRLSGPLGMLNFLEMAAGRGILIKDGRCLEILRTVDTVVFDKTGTLTLDQPQVAYVHLLAEVSETEVLRLAAAAEARQTHPIAHAIRAAAEQRNITLPPLDDARYEVGHGLKVNIEHHVVHVGSARYMDHEQVRIAAPEQLAGVKRHCDQHGFSLVYVACDHLLIGVLELHVSIRPEAREVIQQLQRRGLDLAIVSGDNEQPTAHLAAQVGISRYHANVLPDEKAALIERLRGDGKSICFVGDGINDAVALKTANVGISIHGASDAALDTANVILMDRTLNELGTLFNFADGVARTHRHGYYATMIPSAAGAAGVIWLGFGLPVAIGLYTVSGIAATATAMWPRLVHDRTRHLPVPPQT